MADQRFHKNSGPFRLDYLAHVCEGSLANPKDADKLIEDVAALSAAEQNHISFLDNPRYIEQFTRSHAGACVVNPEHADKAPPTMALILSNAPYRAHGLIAATFYPDPRPAGGIHSSAVIDSSAQIGENCYIGPGVVIEEGVRIGNNTVIKAHSVIGRGVEIGDDCRIDENCVLTHTLMGRKVVLLPGVKLGQPGFGFYMDRQGHINIPQLGRVVIHDEVEIGANSTVDRGAAGDTVVGKGSRIDNLVQIGHNVHIGRGCVIVAQVGIAGSTKLGDHVIVAGQAGIAGHLNIGNYVKIAAQSGVMRDIADNEAVAGSPAVSGAQWHRQNIMISKLTTDKNKRG